MLGIDNWLFLFAPSPLLFLSSFVWPRFGPSSWSLHSASPRLSSLCIWLGSPSERHQQEMGGWKERSGHLFPASSSRRLWVFTCSGGGTPLWALFLLGPRNLAPSFVPGVLAAPCCCWFGVFIVGLLFPAQRWLITFSSATECACCVLRGPADRGGGACVDVQMGLFLFSRCTVWTYCEHFFLGNI